MPDSPAEVKTQPRSTPPSMPPPPPAASQGATRPPSFTPHTHREDGPATLPHGRFHGCLKWSMVCLLMNGSSHSPTAISGAPSTPNGFSNGPATSSTASLSTQHLPPACGARQLSKLKRFLTALQQFGSDISPEIGERVRTLVLGLVNSTLTIEEFHSKLQEATNFPLRPFVIPFLKANLPLLQRELLHCARLAKQTPAQYLAQHEQLLLDASASSPIDSSELLLEVNENGKRRIPDRTKENGLDRDPLHPEHLSKRPCTLNPAQRYSPSNGPPQPTPPHYRLEDIAMAHHFRDAYRHADPRELRERHRPLVVPGSRQEEVIDHKLTEREWAEEWKHLNNLLNCIMDMVEKTRRSLTVLRRCQEADREELNHWARRCSDTEDTKKGPSPATARPRSSSAGPEGCQLDVPREFLPRTLTGYMPEDIWRKAGEWGLPGEPCCGRPGPQMPLSSSAMRSFCLHLGTQAAGLYAFRCVAHSAVRVDPHSGQDSCSLRRPGNEPVAAQQNKVGPRRACRSAHTRSLGASGTRGQSLGRTESEHGQTWSWALGKAVGIFAYAVGTRRGGGAGAELDLWVARGVKPVQGCEVTPAAPSDVLWVWPVDAVRRDGPVSAVSTFTVAWLLVSVIPGGFG
ncbi:protein CBFA2T3 [Piliocolobus tephrosceles]|uniref:protein CBFA2T3 n=1 Tax=Piliocolobus tephrosceles TaxID=591936 RepID=UPI000E6B3AFD|nr:protein CBFA2T3 [Piliocolobus tephrosceles]